MNPLLIAFVARIRSKNFGRKTGSERVIFWSWDKFHKKKKEKKKNYTIYIQGPNQEIFTVREVSWNKKRCVQESPAEFFLVNTHEKAFKMRNLTNGWMQSRHFLKIFKKEQKRSLPLVAPLIAITPSLIITPITFNENFNFSFSVVSW